MACEIVNVDSVIDRLYLRYKGRYVAGKLIHRIYDNLKTILVSKPPSKEYIEERLDKLTQYQKILENLITMPKTEQRSPEWYNMRNNMITASDMAQALGQGKFGTQKQFFQKKCGYEKDDVFDQNLPALKWGVMYEPVAIDAYAFKYNAVMNEFGLLPHPNIKWFGASPDSINELGIMLEIKCPWKRKITGEIPTQYFYQMQGQMDVCNLEECDYLECEFLEYDTQNEFINHFHDNTNEKGIVIEYNTDKDKYKYSKVGEDLDSLLNWLNGLSHEYPIIKIHFWQLYTFNVIRVYRDKEFLTEKFKSLEEVWNKIQVYKSDKSLYDKEIGQKTEKTESKIKQVMDICTTTYDDVKIKGFSFKPMED
jgi:putative phage-type endonuclease